MFVGMPRPFDSPSILLRLLLLVSGQYPQYVFVSSSMFRVNRISNEETCISFLCNHLNMVHDPHDIVRAFTRVGSLSSCDPFHTFWGSECCRYGHFMCDGIIVQFFPYKILSKCLYFSMIYLTFCVPVVIVHFALLLSFVCCLSISLVKY